MPVGRSVLQGTAAQAAGLRDKYVLIEQMTITGGGFPVETWSSLGYAWMSKEDLTADERFTAGQLSAYAGAKWVLAYQANMDSDVVDVPTTRRLSYLGRTYDIVAAAAIGRHQAIELLTVAQTQAD